MVNVSVQEKVLAWGQGYFFLEVGVLLLAAVAEEGVLGSGTVVAESGAWDMGGREFFVVADDGVGC